MTFEQLEKIWRLWLKYAPELTFMSFLRKFAAWCFYEQIDALLISDDELADYIEKFCGKAFWHEVTSDTWEDKK